jgi:hypothetical protein
LGCHAFAPAVCFRRRLQGMQRLLRVGSRRRFKGSNRPTSRLSRATLSGYVSTRSATR